MTAPDKNGITRYLPVGRCIYCNATKNLSDEHILPFGLGGTLLLPESSCDSCAAVTSGVERSVLKTTLDPYRVGTNLPTRRPKKRPKAFPMVLREADGSASTVSASADHYPYCCLGLVLPPPGMLTDTEPASPSEITMAVSSNVRRFAPHAAGGRKVVVPLTMNPWKYIRLIAKIAHGYAVSVYGIDNFTPLLTDLILGRTESFAALVGGSGENLSPRQDALHELTLDLRQNDEPEGDSLLLARVQLFARDAMPVYHVAVGTAPPLATGSESRCDPFTGRPLA